MYLFNDTRDRTMKLHGVGILLVGLLLGADDTPENNAKKQLSKLQGYWTVRKIAGRFGVSPATVYNIGTGKTRRWAHSTAGPRSGGSSASVPAAPTRQSRAVCLRARIADRQSASSV